MAAAKIQSHFPKTFEDAEKEIELGIVQVRRALHSPEPALSELKQLKKKVNESFLAVKKTVTKFNTSALYFIGLNADHLNLRFLDFLTGAKNDLAHLTDKRPRDCKGKLDRKIVVKTSQSVSVQPKGEKQKQKKFVSVEDMAKKTAATGINSSTGKLATLDMAKADENIHLKRIARTVDVGDSNNETKLAVGPIDLKSRQPQV